MITLDGDIEANLNLIQARTEGIKLGVHIDDLQQEDSNCVEVDQGLAYLEYGGYLSVQYPGNELVPDVETDRCDECIFFRKHDIGAAHEVTIQAEYGWRRGGQPNTNHGDAALGSLLFDTVHIGSIDMVGMPNVLCIHGRVTDQVLSGNVSHHYMFELPGLSSGLSDAPSKKSFYFLTEVTNTNYYRGVCYSWPALVSIA